MKLKKVNAEKLNDKTLNQFKMSLFELKDENLPLRLDEPDELVMATANDAAYNYNEIHGRWLIVNGNKLGKKEAKSSARNP